MLVSEHPVISAEEGSPVAAMPQWQCLLGRVVNLQGVLALALGALILLAVPRTTADPDIWWHLRNAQLMLQNSAFVRHDAFSFTVHGVPWIDHEWLAELPFYLGWRLLGFTGVYLVGAGLVLLIFSAVLLLCRRASHSMVVATAATLVAAMLSVVSFGPRTLLFGWLLFCAQMLILERVRQQGQGRAALLLPLLYLLWVNLHGSWLIGLAVLLLTVVAGQFQFRHGFLHSTAFPREVNRCLLLAMCGIVPALFCNPWGWRLVAYPFNFAFRQTLNVASIEEWRSLQFHSLRGEIVAGVVLLMVVRQLWRPRAWAVDEVLLFTGSLLAACLHERFLFLFALVSAPIAARSFQRSNTAPARPAGSLVINGLLLALVLLSAMSNLRRQANKEPALADSFPVAALPALDALPPGSRLFHEFNWGGYLLWTRPALPVFIDSRVDIYEYNGVFQDYLDTIRIKDPLGLLDRYRINAVLFEQDTPLTYLLRRTPGWQVAWSDAHTVLFVRR